MSVIYFYDTTELDTQQLTASLKDTDHTWHFVEDSISLENIHPETEVLSVFVSSSITAEIIDALPNLKLIACRSTGFNNIDMDKATANGVTVLNVPSYGEATVAEYAFTLIQALVRTLPLSIHAFDQEIETTQLMGHDLNSKTIGVIGTGRIGMHSIKIAKGYEMNVIAYDPFPRMDHDGTLDFTYVSLDELLAQSDIVTIHAPYTGANKHIINADNIALMKPTAVIINTARGELVDTKALTQALQEKKIAGAALDVIEGEQLIHVDEEMALLRGTSVSLDLYENSVELLALHKMPNVILTPHNAFNTEEAVGRINGTTAENIIQFWYGDTKNIVKVPSKTSGKLILVRHAESEWNASGKWTGTTDVHLSEVGFHEAGMFGVEFRKLDLKLDRAFCSEQIRALETLEGILNSSQQFDVPIDRTGAINERDYGGYTGANKWEMKQKLGEEQFNRVRRGWNVPIPNGETLQMVYNRAVPFYVSTIVPMLNDGKNIMIMAHGNSIRALMKYIESIDDVAIEDVEMLIGDLVVYDTDHEGRSLSRSDHYIDIAATKA